MTYDTRTSKSSQHVRLQFGYNDSQYTATEYTKVDWVEQKCYSFRSKQDGSLTPAARRMQRIANPHACDLSKWEVRDAPGSRVFIPYPGYTYWIDGEALATAVGRYELPTPGSPKILLPEPETPMFACYCKCVDKQKRMEVDFGENLGELTSTIKMLRNPLSSLHTLLRKWSMPALKRVGKSASKSKVAESLQVLADTWLEYRYGIQPMIYTLVDGLASIDSVLQPSLRITKGSHEPVVFKTVEDKTNAAGDWFVVDYRKEVTNTAKATYIMCSRFHSLNRWAEKWGLTPFDVPALVWELTPYSVFVDWFIDVGSMVRALTPDPRYEVLYGLYCIKNTQKTVFTEKATYLPSLKYRPSSGSIVEIEYNRLRRIVNPELQLSLVYGSGISSIKRVLDTLSLGIAPALKQVLKVQELFKKR